MSALEARILVVEDEAHMRLFLRTTLTHHGYTVIEAADGGRARAQLSSSGINLVLLDLGLPDVDGINLTAIIRRVSDVPIIVISARDAEESKIAALDCGANDYVTKPFSSGELLARIRVALRASLGVSKSPQRPPSLFTVGALRIDFERRLVMLRGQEVSLTPTEYNLLTVLVREAGRVVTHRELLTEVWGPEAEEQLQYLRVYMRQLRYKLEREPAQPEYLVTVSGVGYRLKGEL